MTDSISANVLDLLSGIQINPEAIVSRTLTKGESFNMTLFAFDRDQALTAHSSPMDAWVQILSGGMEITVGNDTHHVSVGQLLLMPAGVPHALVAHEPTRMLLTMLKPTS